MSKEQKQKKNEPQATCYYRADWETGKVYREPDGVEVAGFDREDGEITGLFVATSSGDYDLICEAAKQVWELHRPKYSEAQMQEIRLAVARYMRSEGCSCCQSDNHGEHREAVGRLLGFPAWDDEPDKHTNFYQVLEEAGELRRSRSWQKG